MTSPFPPPWRILSATLLSFTLACGGGDSNQSAGADGGSSGGGGGGGSLLQTGEGPCEDGSECAGGVCVAIIDDNHPPVYCTQECGACPADFWCDSDTFALVGLSFCRFGDTPNTPPEPPPEPPRIPCRSDASCDDGLVCATFQGERDCTLPCSEESQCSASLAGVVVDMHNCEADQSPGEDRDVCLPDPVCFTNPTSCIGGLPGF